MSVETRVLNHVCQQRLRDAAADPRARLIRHSQSDHYYRILATSPVKPETVIYATISERRFEEAWAEARALWRELRGEEVR